MAPRAAGPLQDERTSLLSGQNGSAEPSPHHNIAGLPALRFRLICVSVWFGAFFVALDSTIVATLLSDIGSDFKASNQASWLGTAYLLSLCCFTPIYGRLSDVTGRRPAYLIASTFFLLGTLGCAIAPSMNALIAARAIAGVGGGGVQSLSVIVISDIVSVRYRGLFQGYANLFFGGGTALGGPLGGWIAETFGWRAAFWFQVPLFAIAMIMIWFLMRIPASKTDEIPAHSVAERFKRIDFLGCLTLIPAIGSLVLALSVKTSAIKADGNEYAWSDPLVWGLLVTSAASTLVFLLVEAYVAPLPLLPLVLLRRRTPGAVAWSSLAVVINQFSLIYNLPLFFTAVRLNSASAAGAHLFAYSAVNGMASLATGWIIRRSGRYYWIGVFGAGLMSLSWGLMCFWDRKSPEALLWIGQIPNGLGYTTVLTAGIVALMNDVTREGKGEQAVATSMNYMFRMLGQVLGVALSAAVVQSVTTSDLKKSITGEGAQDVIDLIRHSTSSIRGLEPKYRTAAVDAYNHALHIVFLADLVLSLIGLAAVVFIKEEAMPDQTPTSVSQDEDEA